jgi:PIN domain nuclease of toxin-antitoxin system
MQLLLDTHILIWWLDNSISLADKIKNQISDIDNIVYVSSATIWEISIKQSIGKLKLPGDLLEGLEQCGFEELKINHKHASAAGQLPNFHKDPFDRMLIAQCKVDGLTLMTRDSLLKKYNVGIIVA